MRPLGMIMITVKSNDNEHCVFDYNLLINSCALTIDTLHKRLLGGGIGHDSRVKARILRETLLIILG